MTAQNTYSVMLSFKSIPMKGGRGMPPRRPWSPPVRLTQVRMTEWMNIWKASVMNEK